MKKLALAAVGLIALAAPAVAADLGPSRMPAKAAVMAAPVVFNWTGFYVGAHIGAGWSSKDAALVTTGGVLNATGASDPDGFLGGLQAGFNWQFGQWVFGVEGQVSWSDMDGTGSATVATPGFFITGDRISTDIDFVATLAARLGIAFDQALIYVKGGVAWANEDHWVATAAGVPLTTTVGDTRTGWMLGVGLEYAFAPNWSAKIEYNFMDFGDDRYAIVSPAGVSRGFLDIDQQMHVVKFGVNYRFGWGGPVAARY